MTKTERKAILHKVGHLLVALTVLLKGLAKMEHPEGYWPLILFLFAGGAYIALITVFHDRLHRHGKFLDASIYAIECLVMASVTYLYVKEGRHALQYVTGLAALAFAVTTVVRLVKAKPHAEAEGH